MLLHCHFHHGSKSGDAHLAMLIFQILLKMKLINAVPLSVLIPRAGKGNWLISPPRLSTFHTTLCSKWHGWTSTGYNHLWSPISMQSPLSFSYRSERLCRHRNNLAFRRVFDKRAIEGKLFVGGAYRRVVHSISRCSGLSSWLVRCKGWASRISASFSSISFSFDGE